MRGYRYAPPVLLGFPRRRSPNITAAPRRAPTLLPVQKPGGGVRWLTRLDPADEAAYRAAVTPLVGRIERSLGPEVLAIRTGSGGARRATSWRRARTAWLAALRTAVARAPRGTAFAVTDVRACYASIAADTVHRLLGPEAASAVVLLRRFADEGVRGLPIGPEPSAVLANAALARLDASLRDAGVRHVRWVDDIVAWGPRADVRRALAWLRPEAAWLGLELHDGKTALLDAPGDVRAVVLGRRPSAIGDRPAGIIAAP